MDYPISVPNVSLLNGKFTDGNPSAGVPASLDPSAWANLVTDELLNLLQIAGIAPSETNATQVASAIQAMQTNYGTDTGGANAYSVAYNPALTTFHAGMVLCFSAASANTGSSTLSVNGTGAGAIFGLSGAPLQGGEITAGSMVTVLRAAAGMWILLSSSGGAMSISPGTQTNHAVNLGQIIHGEQQLTASGTFTVPPHVYFIKARAWSAGGGGGATPNGSTGTAAAGGAAGGYVEGWFSVSPGQVFSVTIGAGGGGGSNGTAGGQGGTTSLGAFFSVSGGGGGAGVSNGAALGNNAGGVASGGAFSMVGQGGGSGVIYGNAAFEGGRGGSAWAGASPMPNVAVNVGDNGLSGIYPGGGGGGGVYGGAGAAGANGLIIVEW